MKNIIIKLKSFFKTVYGKSLITAISLIPAAAAIVIALYYIWGPGVGYLHADCTDTLYWANATVESGKVFDESYRYAGLLPFSAALWMVPLIKLFGFTMLSQNLGMSIFVLVFAYAIWFLCRSAKIGTGWTSAAIFTVMMIASSSPKLLEIMYGHTIYYSLSLPIMCFCIGFAIRAISALEQNKILRGCIWLGCLILMCTGTATDGGQVIVIASLPVIAGLIAERIFCGKDKLFSQKSVRSWIAVIAALAGTVTGIGLLAVWKGDNIDSGYANAYSGWTDVSGWIDNAQMFVKQWFSLLGVEISPDGLFSKASIPAIIRIMCGIAILVIPLIMLVFYRRLSSSSVKIALWGHLVISAAVMFGFICGKLSGANWRLTPIVCSSALLSLLGARELCLAGKSMLASETPSEAPQSPSEAVSDKVSSARVLVRLGVIVTGVLILSSVIVFNEIKKMPADYGRDNYNHVNAEFIESKGLEYGYATFWNCQTITLLSDSKVKCREILANKSGVYTDYYQSSRKWYVDQDYDKFFVLLSSGEYSNVSTSKSWITWTSKYLIESYTDEDGLYSGYYLFVFDTNVLELTIDK